MKGIVIMKKILIIGANGFVGGNLALKAKENGFEAVMMDIADTCSLQGYEYYKCDITDYNAVKQVFQKVKPNLCVNVAAIADIDFAEKNKELAYAVNVTGAANCAKAAKETDTKYVWFSSDAVFSGEDDCYYETSEPNPQNYYGQTKMIGEREILKVNADAIILRISLVIGFPLVFGNSFVKGLYDKLSKGQSVNATVNEVRTPIEVSVLCSAIYELYELNFSGIINIGSLDSINRYDLTVMLAEHMGFDKNLVIKSTQTDITRAKRHKNGIINVEKAKSILKKTKLLTVKQSVNAIKINNN